MLNVHDLKGIMARQHKEIIGLHKVRKEGRDMPQMPETHRTGLHMKAGLDSYVDEDDEASLHSTVAISQAGMFMNLSFQVW
jgi:hypothetical protein